MKKETDANARRWFPKNSRNQNICSLHKSQHLASDRELHIDQELQNSTIGVECLANDWNQGSEQLRPDTQTNESNWWCEQKHKSQESGMFLWAMNTSCQNREEPSENNTNKSNRRWFIDQLCLTTRKRTVGWAAVFIRMIFWGVTWMFERRLQSV